MTQRKPMEVTFDMILKAYNCREQFEKAPSGGFSLVINRGENYLPSPFSSPGLTVWLSVTFTFRQAT